MASELRACIPGNVYRRISDNFPTSTSNYLKTVKVAARYMRELRSESERQQTEIEELKTDCKYKRVKELEMILERRDETIKEKDAYIDRLLMSGFQGLVEDMGASENSKLQAQYEAKVKEVKALKQQVEELQDLLLGTDAASDGE